MPTARSAKPFGVLADASCSLAGYISRAMANRFGVLLHPDDVRWAAAEGVSETIIAAVLLLHKRSERRIPETRRKRCRSRQSGSQEGACCGRDNPRASRSRSAVHRAKMAIAKAEAKKELAVAEITSELLGRKLSIGGENEQQDARHLNGGAQASLRAADKRRTPETRRKRCRSPRALVGVARARDACSVKRRAACSLCSGNGEACGGYAPSSSGASGI